MPTRLQLATTFSHEEVRAFMQAFRIIQRTPETSIISGSEQWQSLAAKFTRMDVKAKQ